MLNYIMLFIIYGFLGWVVEVFYVRLISGHFYNRGFLHMPFLPIYAAGAVIITICLGNIPNPIILYILGVVLTSGLEYFTSLIMEKLFHTRWWDYTNHRYNLHGRICLRNSLLFGVLVIIVIYGLNPIFYNLISNLSQTNIQIIINLFTVIFIIDLAYTLRDVSNLPIRDIRIISGKVKAYRSGKLKSLEELLEELEEFKIRDELKKYTNRLATKYEIHRSLIVGFVVVFGLGIILKNTIILELVLALVVLVTFIIFYQLKHKKSKQ